MRITAAMLDSRFAEVIRLLKAHGGLDPEAHYGLSHGSASNGVTFEVVTIVNGGNRIESLGFGFLGKTKASAYAAFDGMAHALRMLPTPTKEGL